MKRVVLVLLLSVCAFCFAQDNYDTIEIVAEHLREGDLLYVEPELEWLAVDSIMYYTAGDVVIMIEVLVVLPDREYTRIYQGDEKITVKRIKSDPQNLGEII